MNNMNEMNVFSEYKESDDEMRKCENCDPFENYAVSYTHLRSRGLGDVYKRQGYIDAARLRYDIKRRPPHI